MKEFTKRIELLTVKECEWIIQWYKDTPELLNNPIHKNQLEAVDYRLKELKKLLPCLIQTESSNQQRAD